MPLPPAPPTRLTLELRWIAGFALVAILLLAAGAWQHHLGRQNPLNDQPLVAQVISVKVNEADKHFFVSGLARYSLDGRSHEGEFVDFDDFTSSEYAAAKAGRLVSSRTLRVYCQRLEHAKVEAESASPCALGTRLNLRHETTWSWMAMLLGGALGFTAVCIYPINRYGRWAANAAPDWVRELGFLPFYLLGVPVVVGLMLLFDWYWTF
jgi:hypothetical protein